MFRRPPVVFMPRRGHFGRGMRPVRQLHATMILLELIQRIFELEETPVLTVSLIGLLLSIFGIRTIHSRIPRHLRRIMHEIAKYTSIQHGCLRPRRVLHNGEYNRLWVSSLIHSDEYHVLFNCLSFLYKGVVLENALGIPTFFALMSYLSVCAHLIYVGVAVVAERHGIMGLKLKLMDRCVVGFSGVIFGLKVVVNSDPRFYAGRSSTFFGIRLPSGYAHWTELLLVHILVPNASFLGHLSGILAGLLYVYLPKIVAKRLHRIRPLHRLHQD